MDISKSLNDVQNLRTYRLVSQKYVANNQKPLKIQLNMSTILSLKKIRSLEIDYFSNYNENGAAVKFFEQLLLLPVSKTWAVLAKDLISTLKYWMENLTTHNIMRQNNWWSFLQILLQFIMDIRTKHSSINNIVIEELAECFLNLSTHTKPELAQRHKIIECFNMCSVDCSREIRFALRNRFEQYFIKLSEIISSCGDFRVQYSILETLIRWLLPRLDMTVRKEAAVKWFPSQLYNKKAVEIFLERQWIHFVKDARDFLNAQNETSDAITSVRCKKLIVGDSVVISETHRRHWIDLNTGNKCISVMLDIRTVDVQVSNVCEALVIDHDNVNSVQMITESSNIKVELITINPKRLGISHLQVNNGQVGIYVGGENLIKLDRALRTIFLDKYKVLVNIDKIQQLNENKTGSSNADTPEEEARFSHPVEVRRASGKHSGVIFRRNPELWRSPSTASTSSLAMLREKLTAFPGCKFEREPVSICALPQLSSVTEVSETEEAASIHSNSTLKLKTYGVSRRLKRNKPQSEPDERYQLSPVHDESSVSCLLMATIGSVDESVINDTLERLPGDTEINTDNIVELLVREALQKPMLKDKNEQDIEIIENTIAATLSKNFSTDQRVERTNQSQRPVETDESNNDIVENTPNIEFCTTLNKSNKHKITDNINKSAHVKQPAGINENQTFNNDAVESFFAQHFQTDRNNEIIISPTLAKKINETSSESSEFDIPENNDDNDIRYKLYFNELDVVECLNDIVDKVCTDIEKCSQYIQNKFQFKNMSNMDVEDRRKSSSSTNNQIRLVKKPRSKKGTNIIKLKFATKPKTKKKNKLEIEKLDAKNAHDDEKNDAKTNYQFHTNIVDVNANETPLNRRKRKLYSPKDDQLINEQSQIEEVIQSPPDFKKYKDTPKSKATPYKDIKEIQKTKRLRNKKLIPNPVSPRTRKANDIFDNLKKSTNNNINVTSTDIRCTRRNNVAVYNFSCDSEGDYFQEKMKMTKTRSNLTVQSDMKNVRSTRSRRNIKKIDYSDIISNPRKIKRAGKNQSRENQSKILVNDIIDEKMRHEAPCTNDELNTSFRMEVEKEISDEPQPIISVVPKMDTVKVTKSVKKAAKTSPIKRSKRNNKRLKANDKQVSKIHIENEESICTLPGLIIEISDKIRDPEDSIIALDRMKDNIINIPLDKSLDIDTTHNLLSDMEPITASPHELNTDDINFNEDSRISHKYSETKLKSNPQHLKSNKDLGTNKNKNKISNSSDSNKSEEISREKSIATIGKSPITGHGNKYERPPDFKQLKQYITPRDIEVQNFDESTRNYYKAITNETNLSKSRCSSKHLSSHTVVSSVRKSLSVTIERLSFDEIRKWMPRRTNSVFESNQSTSSNRSIQVPINNIPTSKPTELKQCDAHLYSSISPIKLYGEKQATVKSEEEYVEKIKSVISSNKKTESEDISARYYLRKCRREKTKEISDEESKETKEDKENLNEIPVINKSGTKNKTVSVSVSESAASVSVNKWLKESEEVLTSQLSHESASTLKDTVKILMEKVDTTLVEMQYNTNRKYCNMFVDLQSQLKRNVEQRNDLFKQTAKDIMKDFVQILDGKFKELDERCQEIDENFRSNFKNQAQMLIRADCAQKRQFIEEMKNDLQNNIKHAIKRSTRD